jgi:transaldolase
MPEATLDAVADHGDIRGDTISGSYEQARALFDQLERVGVDLADVGRALEEEGVEKFETSWADLYRTVEATLQAGR